MYKMSRQRMLSTLLHHKRIVKGITNTSMRKNPHYVLSYIFLEYLDRRLQRLSGQNLEWAVVSDTALKRILDGPEVTWDEYVDYDSCAVANIQFSRKSAWFNVYSMASRTKYKLMIISIPDISENTVLVSETMARNLRNALRCEKLDGSCFIREYRQLGFLMSILNYLHLLTYL